MAYEKITSLDVARKAGVSQSAVSRVLTPGASASKKTAEKAGLKTSEYEGNVQITSRRKVDFDRPKIYNKDRDLVDVGHLSLFGDKVTVAVKQGKGDYSEYTYLEAIRVEEKAEGVEDFDPSEF